MLIYNENDQKTTKTAVSVRHG